MGEWRLQRLSVPARIRRDEPVPRLGPVWCPLLLIGGLLVHAPGCDRAPVASSGSPGPTTTRTASATQPAGTAPEGEIISIASTIISGKPGAPYETVTVQRTGDGARLSVERGSNDQRTAGGQANVPLALLDELRAVVKRHQLLQFRPEPGDQTVDDFGSRRLELRWKDAGGQEQISRQVWHQPIKNAGGPAAIEGRLAAAAKKYVKDPALNYFPR